ncbi:sulfate transporter family-domain-containing protein [Mycotypha africana]|uniref:sulfate transporter family-domain-containing protein n=1 Tax=Mycotypha africana TaxID=64632 RepID=UPI002301A493|nr:sulfate transporter family-domain-containing protein [Mycotypha africana]KAI8975767.1 sulfate transporter family-domain-containing protein [Mycotypha africana]
MSRRNSTATTLEEGSVPKDIKGSIVGEEVPSRSYYSSHLNYDTTEGEPRYSASNESIRAHSLALGDKYMQTTSPTSSPSSSVKNVQRTNFKKATPSTFDEQSTTHSVLSHLLQKDDHKKKKDSSSEREPLLRKRKSKDYQSNAVAHEQQDSDDADSNSTIAEDENGEDEGTMPYQSQPNENPEQHYRQTHQLNKYRSSQKRRRGIWEQLRKNPKQFMHTCLTQPIQYIPAVILGLLLNLLDAISYGMITFPLNNPIFASFGPDGISMFFVSCIISQIVYSTGSVFDGGNGSMMIEVVPFLHLMAEKIISVAGQNNPAVVIPSTMVAFALSSIMTGLAFFLLGALKLGSLIGFFPRHILIGTIGGVGWFLVATGIEVSGRLDENLVYTIPMFKKLFLNPHVFSLWFSALAVALLLRLIQHRISSPLVVPTFFMALPVAFYVIVFALGLDVSKVRDDGWIFPLVESDTPFWHFYTLYDFRLVDWRAVAETIPAMLALTFFGVLHVPINVPALGVSTNKDDVNVNRELVAHGISNAVSGLLGSVQNYLVYTNSLLFIRSGGDSRVAGFMLAGATAILWIIGPWIVGYIPVMVVGSLIFHLGLDLLKEALIDTWNAVHYLEYITICVIIVCMATLGFVEGIVVGIIMACIFFVVQNSCHSQVIRGIYTGQYMRSTVRRLYRQERFLERVGGQIQIVKLQGYLFFGTIDQVERAIRGMLDEHVWGLHPIRFLILDLQLVQGLDFSAAEAFVRIRRLLRGRQVYMIMCNVEPRSEEEKALVKAGVLLNHCEEQDEGDLKRFEGMNDAIEWCENVLLATYFEHKPKNLQIFNSVPPSRVPMTTKPSYSYSQHLAHSGSPRYDSITNAICQVFDESHAPVVHKNTVQPTLILVQAFGEIDKGKTPIDFFHKLSQYFERGTCEKGYLYREGDPCDYLLILEQGCLRSLMYVANEEVTVEIILPGAVVGEIGIFSAGSSRRGRSLMADTHSVYWKLTRDAFDRMCQEDPKMANQFILLAMYFTSERLDTITKYAFHLH